MLVRHDTRCPLCRATAERHVLNLDLLRIAGDVKEAQKLQYKRSSITSPHHQKKGNSEIDELTDMFNLQLCDLQEQQAQIEHLKNQLQRVQRDVTNSRRAFSSEIAYYKSACAELNRRLQVTRAEKLQANAELAEMRIMNDKQRMNQRTRSVVTRRPRWMP